MTRRSVLGALVACVIAGGCERIDGPVEPVWDKQPCAHCSMVMSDRRFGAQLVTAAGERRFFDDVGCLVMFLGAGAPPASTWVRNAAGRGWIDWRRASFVDGASSPMDYGFEADEAGGIGWQGMRAEVLRRGRQGS